jgi:steroid 5-alpha reductase family enzyme
LDYVATLLLLTAVFVESIADNQQFAFQSEKNRLRAANAPLTGEYADGFNQSGLFALVRKPNYACEQCVWISFYLFSIAATQCEQLWNWSGMGWVLLCLLFQGSGWFTESITISKYPKYKHYQKSTPLYVPNLMRLLKSKAD